MRLVAAGMYRRLDEMWIAQQPFLLLAYLNTYAPWVTRQILKVAGPVRVKVLREGGNVFDLKASEVK